MSRLVRIATLGSAQRLDEAPGRLSRHADLAKAMNYNLTTIVRSKASPRGPRGMDTIHGQPPEPRLAARHARSAPVMADLHAWMEATLRRISGNSDLAKASYILIPRFSICSFRY